MKKIIYFFLVMLSHVKQKTTEKDKHKFPHKRNPKNKTGRNVNIFLHTKYCW